MKVPTLLATSALLVSGINSLELPKAHSRRPDRRLRSTSNFDANGNQADDDDDNGSSGTNQVSATPSCAVASKVRGMPLTNLFLASNRPTVVRPVPRRTTRN